MLCAKAQWKTKKGAVLGSAARLTSALKHGTLTEHLSYSELCEVTVSETFQNRLFCGDNLEILREYLSDASVDLIYLDPPFNSNRNYNVLFRDESGIEADAQITAFEDTWHWDRNARNTYENLLTETPDRISRMIEALRAIR